MLRLDGSGANRFFDAFASVTKTEVFDRSSRPAPASEPGVIWSGKVAHYSERKMRVHHLVELHQDGYTWRLYRFATVIEEDDDK
jgi:hypothetical protein